TSAWSAASKRYSAALSARAAPLAPAKAATNAQVRRNLCPIMNGRVDQSQPGALRNKNEPFNLGPICRADRARRLRRRTELLGNHRAAPPHGGASAALAAAAR